MSNFEKTYTTPTMVKYSSADNSYTRTFEYIVGYKRIRRNLSSQAFDTEEYRAIFTPDNLPVDLLGPDNEITVASLRIKFIPYGNKVDGTFESKFYTLNAKITNNETAAQLWNKATAGTMIKKSPIATNGITVIISDTTEIINSLKYGISIVPIGSSSEYFSSGENIHYYLHKVELSYDISYKSKYAPPVIGKYDEEYINSPITNPLTISWNYEQEMNSPQAYIDISLMNRQGTYEQKILDKYPSSDRTYTIQPEKFIKITYSGEEMIIKVNVYSDLNIISDDKFIHVMLIYPYAVNLSPKESEIILLSDIITLKWEIVAELFSDKYTITNFPTYFDLEYSNNGGDSWNIIAKNQKIIRDNDIYQYAVAGNTFPIGIIMWRIQAYVNNYTIGKYASDVFITRVQASTSSVTCDGKPMPTLSWQSSAQVAYQVRFADYDSGAIYGTATSHTVPYFYADGNYPVQVRTQASNGEWSDWTELEYVAITNSTPPNQIGLTITPTRHAVVADWTDSGVSDNYILYRNGTPIYIGDDKNYTDIAANGKCTYFVRAVTGKYYSQSNAVTVSAYPMADCIYDFSSVTWIPLKFSLSPRSRIYSKSSNVVYNHYAGRDKPIAFTAGHNTRQMSGNYVLKTRDEALRISDLSGKRVVFKDTRGGIIIGILNNVNINVNPKLYSVTFSITETDYKEAVEYAAT